MPVQACQIDGKPGWRYGESGNCYTYIEGDEAAGNEAKRKAYLQGYAATGGKMAESIEDWGNIEELLEITIPSTVMAIDKEAGVIKGVRVLGRTSLNGREYTPEAVRKALGLYEGRPVNVDHYESNGREGQRSVASRIGWLESVRVGKDGGLEGDLHYIKSHPLAEQVVETAGRNPKLFGLSHNADGRTVRRNGKVVVEEIIGVRSVDLVADPATTKSLFESLGQEMQAEDPANPEPSQSDIGEMLIAKIREILAGSGDAASKAAQISKVSKALLKVEDQIDAAMGGGQQAKDSEDTRTPEEIAMFDELNAKLKEQTEKVAALEAHNKLLQDQAEARSLLEAANVEVSDVRIAAIVKADDEAAKKALIESWPPKPLVEDVKPRSAGTPPKWDKPKDAKETAKRLKSRK